ncbi:MAG: sigma-70 family RNA polymerase sigma factor [Planctomycetota bacterium]|jgi:RNA polymerase sigma-70 factor (ECF subfamily)
MTAPVPIHTTDPAAWLDEYGGRLFACALRHVRRHDLAEDLVQETLLAALESADRFEGRSRESTWLIGIMRHKIADHFRRTRRGDEAEDDRTLADWVERRFSSSGKWSSEPLAWPAAAGGDEVDPDLRAALSQCLDRLPTRVSETLLLAERQALTSEMIGRVMSMTATNVGVVLHRARLALRDCLERSWLGGGGDSR